jgi:hypothetical protein
VDPFQVTLVILLTAGSVALVFGCVEGAIDLRERQLWLAVLRDLKQRLDAAKPQPSEPASPGGKLADQFGAAPNLGYIKGLADFAGALKGLPRFLQAWLIACLLYTLAAVVLILHESV